MKFTGTAVLALAVAACATEAPKKPEGTLIAEVDLSKMALGEVDLPALEALLAKKGPMQDVINLIGKASSVTPAANGPEIHIYRLIDKASRRKVTVMVFVDAGRVAGSLVTGQNG